MSEPVAIPISSGGDYVTAHRDGNEPCCARGPLSAVEVDRAPVRRVTPVEVASSRGRVSVPVLPETHRRMCHQPPNRCG